MNYSNHLIETLQSIWSELDHILQEGAVFSSEEKERILKVLNDLEKLVDEFNVY
jgi:hypothetical protein